MAVIFAEQELHSACQVLFGTDLHISRGFLDYLQLSGIKTAYRKKALETHPDLISNKSLRTEEANDLFMAVQQAYESLSSFIGARKQGCIIQPDNTTPHKPHRPANPSQEKKCTKAQSDHFQAHRGKTNSKASSASTRQNMTVQRSGQLHNGPIPDRKLLFGHYLYYAGLANWRTITRALVWQRARRPRIGEIGCSYGWLTSKDILSILKSRALTDSFGKAAVRQGFLTENQLRLLLFQQKRLQKKFGAYFVANNILTETQVNLLVQKFRSHNYNAGSQTTRYRTL